MPGQTAGKLIAIEGLEGAGKSTAVHTVVSLLAERDIQAITVREPGGTAIGEELRAILKNNDYLNILDNRSELLMMYAARVQLLEEVIRPALSQGYWVIADRFELSTYAYQGGGRGIDEDIINKLSGFCLHGFRPHLTLYLDISPEIGMQRASLRGEFDRIEQQAIDFFYRIHTAYIKQVKIHADIVQIDAEKPLAEVQTNIQTVINNYLRQL